MSPMFSPRTEQIFIFFLSWFFAGNITASELSLSRNARTFETQHASLLVKSLGFACLGLTEVPDGLPCNPAATPFTPHAGLKAEGLISNGYANFEKTRKLLTGEADESLIKVLL